MNKIFIEIKDFFKNNLKFILVGTLIVGVLYTAVTVTMNLGNESGQEESAVEEDFEDLYSDGAYFNFYVENEDGTPFNNTSILEQYILMEETLEQATDETNIDILAMFQEERQSSFQRTSENRGVLGLTRNAYSNRLSLIVQTPNQENNLILAEYFYDMIQNDGIPILADKQVYFFETPRELDFVLVSEEVMAIENSSFSLLDTIQRALMSFVFGLIIFSGIALVRVLFSEKLQYSFSYLREEKDQFEMMDKRLSNKDEVQHMLSIPEVDERIILSEEDIKNYNIDKDTMVLTNNASSVRYINDLVNTTFSSPSSEIIMIIVASKTSRRWYRKQRKFLNAYDVPVKVLQINTL